MGSHRRYVYPDLSQKNPNMTLLANLAAQQDPYLLLHPETRPIPQEKLVREVKSIYAGLIMVEAKYVEVVGRQVAAAQQASSPS